MLKHRLITAAILIPLIIFSVLLLPTPYFAMLTSLFILLGAYEWGNLCGWQSYFSRITYASTIALSLAASYYTLLYFPEITIILLTITCLWWLIALYWVWRYQQGYDLLPTIPWLKAGLGLLVLSPAWLALIHLHQHYERHWVIFLLILIWTADSGAYFIGKKWGKRKLAAKVSPGKTFEGVLGALITSGLVAVLYALLQQMTWSTLLIFLAICLLTVLVSILGDLVESLFKRQMDIKDSGQILPGHGGILDRIDSLTAATPVFVLSLLLLGNLF